MSPTTTHLRTTPNDTALLNVREAADALGVTPWWTRRLIASGDLRAINVGGPEKSARWRVVPEDLAAFIRARENRSRDLLR
ncbi:helix-turn-helix domain-containing protein [Microbacterium sp. C7(2022)]|uniref:helix-turn-helix domain-containing protein n=1 Tax=Microbacterium sp. C7(2022) TaxID=2992759 RepID=UPI0034D4B174